MVFYATPLPLRNARGILGRRDFCWVAATMLSKTWGAATCGIDATRIIIEVDARPAQQPGFTMVG
ncbi:MAG TPA: hypothetical protein VF787_28995, partial [Thermoanaerobaculia bacterium]